MEITTTKKIKIEETMQPKKTAHRKKLKKVRKRMMKKMKSSPNQEKIKAILHYILIKILIKKNIY